MKNFAKVKNNKIFIVLINNTIIRALFGQLKMNPRNRIRIKFSDFQNPILLLKYHPFGP